LIDLRPLFLRENQAATREGDREFEIPLGLTRESVSDYTPMDFVEFVLKKVFHISSEDALSLTLAVHTQGKGIAGIYTFEVAEQKQFEVLLMAKVEEHPLRVEVERV
jgi:ATP-dependent Clp protease adaptor protein ClpS